MEKSAAAFNCQVCDAAAICRERQQPAQTVRTADRTQNSLPVGSPMPHEMNFRKRTRDGSKANAVSVLTDVETLDVADRFRQGEGVS